MLQLLAGWARFIATLSTILFPLATSSTEAFAGQVTAVGSDEIPIAKDQQTPRARNAKEREEWQNAIELAPAPKKGCFEARYPNPEWKEVPCVKAPDIPMPPRQGPRPLVVGNTDDIAATAPSGTISSTTGSFTIAGVTSESGQIGNTGPFVADAYTLQINPNFFVGSTACAASTNANCSGWQQWVYFNDGTQGTIFIQYWLVSFGATCPPNAGWTHNGAVGGSCFKNNTSGAVQVPNQPITNLGQLRLTGRVSLTEDGLTLTTDTGAFILTGDNAVGATGAWQMSEFNVFGPGGDSTGAGSQAVFNAGSTVTPRTQINYGGTAPPGCAATGFTAETNNLSFGSPAPASSPPGPALIFVESSTGGATSNCAAATGVGDTHLTTFSGLLYDFQAAGDFLLAQRGPDFVVQTRQVSGRPVWPDATINKAVATRMGKTQVAICTGPERLVIDGGPVDIKNGQTIGVSDDVAVSLMGNAYIVTSQSGDSIRAQVNGPYIDVSVGLGEWPTKVVGLLANPGGNTSNLGMSDGTILPLPVSFKDLYYRYGDSWRVSEKESLLSVCGDKYVEQSNPDRPFYSRDLDPKIYESAQGICFAAGVKEGPLLDACILDVAFFGRESAANVFANTSPPVAVLVAR
ncbi:hypothetical protein G5V57_05440 [Nordella sp. HKS 07]|uniref:VWD domain-containing protein n=1 Tax=Nordella sp. HKS 07 TaxID=2712222 RepID=UPI0013E1F4D9|nr:VWD domain-containing protein [Nordella sp. HKS 07]QIG47220.1 hypothetical protein G5V57_05440 [Nordella sp. HKS 07]